MTDADLKAQLYLIAWQGESIKPDWLTAEHVEALVAAGLVQKTEKGYVVTADGRGVLSPDARMACQRPLNYADLDPSAQWGIDKELGILDWDGS